MRPLPNCLRAARLLPILLAVGLAGAALAGEPNPIVLQRGGLAEAVVIAGQFAYIGQGGTVVTTRLSATQPPTVVDVSLPLPGLVRGMAVYGKILFVSWDGAWSRDQLSLFSLTDPRKPERRGEFTYTAEDESEPRELAVVGDTLYVADARLGLVPIDISDPLAPVAGLPVGWPIEALSVMGNRYLVTGNVFNLVVPSFFDLAAYDISDPLQPIRVGGFGEYSRSDLVAGSDFTVAFPNASRVWTFDDPTSPLAVPLNDPANSQGMLVVRDRLLVPASNLVRVWDLTDPFHPMPGSDVALPVSLRTAKAAAADSATDRALIVNLQNWIVQLDTLDADAPNLQHVVQMPTPTSAVRLTRLGSNLLINEAGRLTLRNQKLELLKRVDFGPAGFPSIMDLEGSLALMMTFAEILVADFSDPGKPTVVGRLPLNRPMAGILQQNLAWVATGDPYEQNVLASVDLSDPAHPQVLHTSEITEGADLALERSTLYLADHFGGLRIFGVSGTAPVPLGQYSECFDVRQVEVVGLIAAISCGPGQVHLVDVSDPTNPTQLGVYAFTVPFMTDRSSVLYTKETGTDRVFIGYPGTIDVVNIHDPANPVLSHRIEVAGWVEDMETTEDGFWAAAGAGGIVRVRLDDEGGGISPTFLAIRP